MGNAESSQVGVGKSGVLDVARSESKTRFWAVVVFFFVVNVVGIVWVQQTWAPDDSLRIYSISPSEALWTSDSLAISFDRPVVTPQQLEQTLVQPPARWQPELAGAWSWSAVDRLVFLPDEPFEKGRRHQLQMRDDFAASYGRRLFGSRDFEFAPMPLALEKWVLDSCDASHVNFSLRFNQKVDPNELEQAIQAYDPNHDRLGGLTVLSRVATDRHLVRLPRPAVSSIELKLHSGLSGCLGETPLLEDRTGTFSLPKTLAFLGASVDTPGSQPRVRAELRFSEPLVGAALPRVTIDPPLLGVSARVRYTRLLVEAPFEANRSYTIHVAPGLQSTSGSILETEVVTRVRVAERRPTINIPFRRGVLSSKGHRQLEVKVANVSTLRLSATQVFPNNLVQHVRGEQPRVTSHEVVSKDVSLTLPRNSLETVVLDLAEVLPEKTGIYRVVVASPHNRWIKDSVVVALTDLAITAKNESDQQSVWVTSIESGKPVAGVTVGALTLSNQLLDEGTTDVDGWVVLKTPKGHPAGNPWLIRAASGAELSYLRVDQHRWVARGVDTGGRRAAQGYDAHLYSERGVYRAGETIFVGGIVRDAQGAVPPAVPLELSLVSPERRVLSRTSVELGEGGVFQVPLTTATDAVLGSYKVHLGLPGGESRIGTTSFLVEAFVPQRLEITAKPQAPHLLLSEFPKKKLRHVHFDVEARYLLGRPAAGLKVRAKAVLRPRTFNPALAEFRFDPIGKAPAERKLELHEITLDTEGRGVCSFALPPMIAQGLWSVEASFTVTETGSRSLTTRAQLNLDATPGIVGIALPTPVINARERVELRLLWLDGFGNPAAAPPFVARLIKEEWDSTLREVNGRWSWQSDRRDEEVALFDATVDDGVRILCPVAGRYRLEVRPKGSTFGSEISFYASYPNEAASVPLTQADHLQLIPERETTRPGEVARVLVRAPFSGTVCVTLENDHVVARSIKSVSESSATIEIEVPRDVRGDLFVCASMVRAAHLEAAEWLPLRSFGVARLKIDRASQVLPVSIQAPPLWVPGEVGEIVVQVGQAAAQTIGDEDSTDGATEPSQESLGQGSAAGLADANDIRVAPAVAPSTDARDSNSTLPIYVQLWGVDEGILRLTQYHAADPLDSFWGARRWEVASSDVFSELLPDFKRSADLTRIGGDGGGFGAARRSLEPIAFKASVVVNQPWQRCDAKGELRAAITLPEHQGGLRWFAVAVQGDRYGVSEVSTLVRSPLSLQVGLPRFLAPGDEIVVPVRCFNNTEDELRLQLAASVREESPSAATTTAPPQVLSWAAGNVEELKPVLTVAAGASVTHDLRLRGETRGSAEVIVEVVAQEDVPLSARSVTPLTVRPAVHLTREVELVSFAAGDTRDFRMPEGFLEGDVTSTLRVSGAPQLSLEQAFRDVIDYPHGCAEQTTSRLLSVLYAPSTLLDSARREPMVRAGIARLFALQGSDGGMRYWPGARREVPWLTAYVADVLTDASELGFDVPNELLKPLLDALERQVSAGLDPAPRAYACAVLARHDRAMVSWLAQLTEQVESLDLAARAHVASGWWAMGQRDRGLALLDDKLLEQQVPTSSSTDRLTSQLTQEALLLKTILRLDPEHGWSALLAKRLEKGLRKRYRSTLENGAMIRALYQFQQTFPDAQVSGTIRAAQKEVNFVGDSLAEVVLAAEGVAQVTSEGKGHIFATLTTEGYRDDAGSEPHDRGLAVRRYYFDSEGKELDLAAEPTLRVGDLIHVEVSLRALAGGAIANVALVDALPACLEVENPKLSGSAAARGRAADRIEFLDDRVVLFATARPTRSVYRYSLRVITEGSFKVPPVQASSMYDGALASLHGGGVVRVVRD